MAQDIVRILQDLAEDKGYIYHYGQKSALTILDATQDPEQIYFLHEMTTRRAEYNSSGTRIVSTTYEGKFFLVKHSDIDLPKFDERDTESTSKYTVNIEPLLQDFKAIGNGLSCLGHTVTQWDNIDVTDALASNMDGILCTYKVKVME